MLRIVKEKIKKYLYNNFYVYNFYQNINLDICNYDQKKVLISYIDSIFCKEANKEITHTNFLEAYVIVKKIY